MRVGQVIAAQHPPRARSSAERTRQFGRVACDDGRRSQPNRFPARERRPRVGSDGDAQIAAHAKPCALRGE